MGPISCPRLSTPHPLFFPISQLPTWQTLTISFPVETIISLKPGLRPLTQTSFPFSSDPTTTNLRTGKSWFLEPLAVQPRFASCYHQLWPSSLLPKSHPHQFTFRVLKDRMYPPGYHITLAHNSPLKPGPVNQVGDHVKVVDASLEPTQWAVEPKAGRGKVYTYVYEYQCNQVVSISPRPTQYSCS